MYLDYKVEYNLSPLNIFVDVINLKETLYHTEIHHHDDLEFIYVLKGSIEYNVNGISLPIQKDNGLFVNSNRLHHGYSNYSWDCTFVKLNLPFDLIKNVCPDYDLESIKKQSNYVELNRFNHKEILSLILEINDLKESNNMLLIASKVFMLYDLIIKELKPIKFSEDRDIKTFLEIAQHISEYYSQNIIIGTFCKKMHISRNKCCDIIKKYANMSFNTFLNYVRLNEACILIANTKRPICEISLECGFASASYFTKNFKKITGLTPKQYREHCKK